MKALISCIILIFLCVNLQAKGLKKDSTPYLEGPNAPTFMHPFMSLGFAVEPVEGKGGDIIYGKSILYNVGLRYKINLTRFEAFCLDLSYNIYNYRLKQDSEKILPDNQLHKKESIRFNQLNFAFANRFTFGKHIGSMGTFLDLYGFAGWMFGSIHSYTDKYNSKNHPNSKLKSNPRLTKSKDKGLPYVNHYNYGIGARFGRNQFVLFAQYRLTDLFKNDYNFPEMPRLIIGLQIGFHK